ncbi:MAG: hypothetical protein ABR579_01000 [Actinomycetota bacterium]
MRRTFVCCVVLVVAAACSHKTAPVAPPVAPVTPVFESPSLAVESPSTAASSSASRCSNEQAVVTNESFRLPGSIAGDVDGDGLSDRVQLALDRAAGPGCQAFLVVQTGSAIISGAIDAWSLEGGLPQPRLHSVAQINGTGGDDVIVDVAAGASSQFVSVLADVDGALAPLAFEKNAPGGFKDMFAYGGSVGHVDGADCAPDGGVVVSSAVAGGTGYRVTRLFFTVHGATLKADPSRNQTSSAPLDGLARFPEFPAAPFGTCPG